MSSLGDYMVNWRGGWHSDTVLTSTIPSSEVSCPAASAGGGDEMGGGRRAGDGRSRKGSELRG